jgi:hypothetical protein
MTRVESGLRSILRASVENDLNEIIFRIALQALIENRRWCMIFRFRAMKQIISVLLIGIIQAALSSVD